MRRVLPLILVSCIPYEPPPFQQACALPVLDSWCGSQRKVAQTIGCAPSDDPAGCYWTIGAQYSYGNLPTLMAGDCDPQDPGCAQAYQACTDAPEPFVCELHEPATIEACMSLALESGILPVTADGYCSVIVATYGP